LWQSRRTCRQLNRLLQDTALSYISRVLLCAAAASVFCSEAHIARAYNVIDRTLQMSGVAAFALDRNDELPVMKESEPNRGPQQLRLLFGFNALGRVYRSASALRALTSKIDHPRTSSAA
jgi:hypothetical protein